MNNKEFTAELARRMEITQKDAANMMDTFADIINREMGKGNDVQLGTLGTFEVKVKEQRIIVNPKTKRRMLVPPKMSAEFRPSRNLKEKCKNMQPNDRT